MSICTSKYACLPSAGYHCKSSVAILQPRLLLVKCLDDREGLVVIAAANTGEKCVRVYNDSLGYKQKCKDWNLFHEFYFLHINFRTRVHTVESSTYVQSQGVTLIESQMAS